MKTNQVGSRIPDAGGVVRGAGFVLAATGIGALLTLALLTAVARADLPATNGLFQEQIGGRIQALGRYDQDRASRLHQRWAQLIGLSQTFDEGRTSRLQEDLGQAIVEASQTIVADRAALDTAIADTMAARRRLQNGSWLQERLGALIIQTAQRFPQGDVRFDQHLHAKTAALRHIEQRALQRLDSRLGTLASQHAQISSAVERRYREAVESARRSARMRDASHDTWISRLLDEVQASLAVPRQPEDYLRLAATVRAVNRGQWGVGGFWEYGAASLLGLIFAAVWVGAATRQDFLTSPSRASAATVKTPLPYQWRNEVIAMSQTTTVFSWPKEVLFGSHVSQEIGRSAGKDQAEHAMILTDQGISQKGFVEPIAASLSQAGVICDVFDQVTREVPHTLVADVAGRCKQAGIDLLVAVGGGSVIDTAKAVGILLTNGGAIQDYEGVDRVAQPIPLLYVVPTTAGCGSEASQFCIVLDTKKKQKVEIFSRKLIPDKIFIDPVLTRSMPPELTASSGMDALANCIEAYFSTWASPLTDALALHATRLIADSLRAAVANGHHLEARQNMALAAFEAGLAFTNAQSGAVHALGHSISGMFDVPQRMGDAILLPHVMRANMNADMARMAKIAEAMGEPVAGLSARDAAGRAIDAVKCLLVDIGLPTTLDKVGVDKKAISMLSEHALQDTFLRTNPRMLHREDIEEIYENAFVEYAEMSYGSATRVTVH